MKLRSILADFFDLVAGGRGLFVPHGKYSPGPPREVVVLAPGDIPTTDLYLRGRLERRYGVAVRHVDTLKTPPKHIRCGDGALIVIVRYAPLPWLRWVESQRSVLAGVVFFMDDDIPAALRAPELPFRYARQTGWRYAQGRRILKRLCSEVWVATPALQRRYARSSPRLLEPGYVEAPAPTEPAGVYFYHGSWAHRREIEWLVSIVRQVQGVVPGAWFEIIGDFEVRRLFRGIPRVRVVHPMPWRDYVAYASLAYAGVAKADMGMPAAARYDVGLAPCFDSEFNRTRSHSKLFDITRLGAAGIYSEVTPYAEKIVHCETGLLCANDPDKWVTAIIGLLNDRELRATLYEKARDFSANKRCLPLIKES